MQPRDPEFKRVIRDSFDRQHLMAHLGARLEHVAPGEVDISLARRQELLQQHGYIHAGATGTIADSAGGYAALSLMPAGHSVLSIEYKMNLLAPARGDRLIARGRVVRSGRTITVSKADVYSIEDGQEMHCATMVQTLIGMPAGEGRPAG